MPPVYRGAMTDRPYVVLSCAISVDGFLDDTTDQRLILSSPTDLDRVDEVRASVDAILVGANTIRRDDPRLVVRSPARRAARAAAGRPPDPMKVTITRSGNLDPESRFFTVGDVTKLVYAASGVVATASAALPAATVVDAGDPPELTRILGDLRNRGVRRLMVEGGGRILSWFVSERLADELHLVIAPRFVGDPKAPRWLSDGAAPPSGLELWETRQLGDCVLLRYGLRPRDDEPLGDHR